jgi:asparagine synthase (glutamine-hydrolysing)
LHFGVDQPNELSYAREVAALAGTDHHEVEVRPRDLRPLLGRMVWHLDEPIGDPVTVGNFLLAEAAAASALWVLNGEGGDPVFGGPKNLPMLLSHWYALDGDLDHRTTQYLATWRRAGEDIGRLLHTDVRAAVNMDRDVAGVMRPHLTAARPPLFLDKLMVTNMRLKGANLILPKVDRMLGAHGMTRSALSSIRP